MKGERWLRCWSLGLLAGWVTTVSAEELVWKNGDRMEGELVALKGDWLAWNSPWFEEPLELRMEALHAWSTGAPEMPKIEGVWCVRLTDGCVFSGAIDSLRDGVLAMNTRQAGRLRLPVENLVDMQRLLREGPLRVGPFGTGDWRQDEGQLPGNDWAMARGGVLVTRSINHPVEWSLPETRDPQLLHLRLRSEEVPDLALELPWPLRLETWGPRLVMVEGERFVPLMTLPVDGAPFDLRLGFRAGPDGGRVTVWDGKGEELARVPVSEPEQKAKGRTPVVGLRLTNLGRHLEVQRVMWSPWNAQQTPTRFLSDQAGVERRAGDAMEGTVESIVNGQVTLVGGSETISLGSLVYLRFGGEHPPTREPSWVPPLDQPWAEIRMRDGTRLEGRWVGAGASRLRLRVAFQKEPLAVNRKLVDRMRFHRPYSFARVPIASGEHEDHWLPSKMDRALRGQWSPRPGGRFYWQPTAARRPVQVVEDLVWGLRRAGHRVATTTGLLPTLVHLDGGECFPVRIEDWSEDRLSVRQAFSNDAVDASAVRGLEWETESVGDLGFDGSGWRQVRGGPERVEWLLDEAAVEIQPGGSIWHPSAMQGRKMAFTIAGTNSYSGGLRIRVFSGDPDSDQALSFIVANWGNEAYCGLEMEDHPGQLRNQAEVPITYGADVRIGFEWDDANLTMRVNGAFALNTPVAAASRFGTGVLFEPASLWGNEMAVQPLEAFDASSPPGARARPRPPKDALGWALQVPRQRQDDPPRHLLIARNGDVLRGTVLSVTPEALRVRNGLEEHRIAADRLSMVVFPTDPPDPAATQDEEAEGLSWVSLHDGSWIHGRMVAYGPETVVIESPKAGRFEFPVGALISIAGHPDSSPPVPFEGWSFRSAPEPDLGETEASRNHPLVGSQAPEISLPRVGEGEWTLADEKGEVVILDFWASWCGPCLRAIPEMLALAEELPEVRLIGVNQGEVGSDVNRFLETRGWELESVLDEAQVAGRAYGVEGIPHTVVVDRDGVVAWVETGFRPEAKEELKTLLEGLLEKTVEEEQAGGQSE